MSLWRHTLHALRRAAKKRKKRETLTESEISEAEALAKETQKAREELAAWKADQEIRNLLRRSDFR